MLTPCFRSASLFSMPFKNSWNATSDKLHSLRALAAISLAIRSLSLSFFPSSDSITSLTFASTSSALTSSFS
uniref:Uncharacterized protein n=1 Tax=Arundo donax TaxID=35708 RepID=A0A0A9AGE7_ARUDO